MSGDSADRRTPESGGVTVLHGEALDVLERLEPESFDAAICDPPHGVLRAAWDELPSTETWRAVLRVLRPGAPLVTICAGRTYHRLAAAAEDAGFLVEDMAIWAFANGKPSSPNHLKSAASPILIARRPGPRAPLDVERAPSPVRR